MHIARPLSRQSFQRGERPVRAIQHHGSSGEAVVDVGRCPQTPPVDPVEFIHQQVAHVDSTVVFGIRLLPQGMPSRLMEPNDAAVDHEGQKGDGQYTCGDAGDAELRRSFELKRNQPDITLPQQMNDQYEGPSCQDAQGRSGQQRDLAIQSPEGKEARDTDRKRQEFLDPCEVVPLVPRGGGPRFESRGFCPPPAKFTSGAGGDAVEILETGWVDNGPMLLDFLMDADIRGACGGTGGTRAAIASGVQTNSARGDPVRKREDCPVGADVAAEGATSEQVDDDASHDEKGQDGDSGARQIAEEVGSDERTQALLIFGHTQFREGSVLGNPLDLRPDEHEGHHSQRSEQQQATANRLGANPEFLESPRGEILKGQDVAAPRAEESPEDQGRDDDQAHEDEAHGHYAQFQREHRLVEFQRGQRLADDEPRRDVDGDHNVYQNEHDGPPAAVATVGR